MRIFYYFFSAAGFQGKSSHTPKIRVGAKCIKNNHPSVTTSINENVFAIALCEN
jgi:hypothetical protein